MVSTCTNVDCFQMSSCPGLEMAVLLELAAKLGLNVHVGFSYRSTALELGVDC